MYQIYIHKVPNGKVYIGYTEKEKLYDRWRYGNGYDNQKEFYNDIVEYGWKNIKHEVLETVETKQEALERESYYILKYRSNEPQYGYNKNLRPKYYKPKKINYYKPKISHQVVCVETGMVYDNCRVAGDTLGVTCEAIRYAIKKNTLCKGFHWAKVESALN